MKKVFILLILISSFVSGFSATTLDCNNDKTVFAESISIKQSNEVILFNDATNAVSELIVNDIASATSELTDNSFFYHFKSDNVKNFVITNYLIFKKPPLVYEKTFKSDLKNYDAKYLKNKDPILTNQKRGLFRRTDYDCSRY